MSRFWNAVVGFIFEARTGSVPVFCGIVLMAAAITVGMSGGRHFHRFTPVHWLLHDGEADLWGNYVNLSMGK